MQISIKNSAGGIPQKLNNKQNNKGCFIHSMAAVIGSGIIQIGIGKPSSILSDKLIYNANKNLSQSHKNYIFDTANNILEQTGLLKKSVYIRDIPSSKRIATFINKQSKSFFNIYDKNSILINKNNSSVALFHEIGHAYNFNNSKLLKLLQRIGNPSSMIASGLALYCAFSNNAQAKDGQKLSKVQKIKNSIRNNAGKIAFAMMLPMLIEESIASIRSYKWAKTELPNNIAKEIYKSNIGGLISYFGGAVSLGIAAFSAVKIKDYLGKKYQEKINSKIDNFKNNSQNSVETR